MSSTISSPAGVVNYALAKVGYKLRVGSLYDGSEAAKKALDIYGSVRDHTLYSGDWDFSQRTVQGTLLKQSPTHPPSYIVKPWTPAYPSPPWEFEYAYPNDAVRIRAVKRLPAFIPNYDPRYNRYWVDNDNGFSPPQKVILCNIPNAIILYTGQVTDPNQWNEGFLNVFADALGKALGPVLMGLDAYKLAATEEAQDVIVAEHSKERS